MIRTFAMELGFFLIPFVLYLLLLLATRQGLLHPLSWPLQRVAWLSVAALLLSIAGLLWFTDMTGAPPASTYVPAHLENGKLVPGVDK